MGLDMFLFRTHKTKEPALALNQDEAYDEVGYWRKANHIHNWFVNNCQNGEDDCGYHEVSKDKLEELLSLCRKVLNPTGGAIPLILQEKIAEKNLPTSTGFFFGSTAYDDGYYEDIKNTIDIIENILSGTDFENESIFYSSSW
jgi:hypothetical protein